MNDRSKWIANTTRVVVKVGSSVITRSPAGCPASLADEISALNTERDLQFVVISSGAIALGSKVLGIVDRPSHLPALQAAAAVGQTVLMRYWEHGFGAHGLVTAQVLLTHDDLSNQRRFLNARNTLRELLNRGVIPIINENDTVAFDEIKYGDNDLLAALVANLIAADTLVMMTDVNGLHDGPPTSGATRIPIVYDIDGEAAPVAGGIGADGVGSGGMSSKVQAAKAAGRHGVATIVVPGTSGSLTRALEGDDIGTLFVPHPERVNSHKHWIAYSAKPVGSVVVNAGAHIAVCNSSASLLPTGVTEIDGDFHMGDIVRLIGPDGTEFARGLAGRSARDMRDIVERQSGDIEGALDYKYIDELIHRDDLVLL